MPMKPMAGGIIQRRAPRADGWTKARKSAFLGGLAQSCNVTATCRALGLDPGSAYKRRVIDAEFARQWDWALQQGYVRLEGELLQRAISTEIDDETISAIGAGMEAGRSVDTELGLKLLALRDKADQAGRRGAVRFAQPTPHQVLEALDQRLTAMEKRLGKRP